MVSAAPWSLKSGLERRTEQTRATGKGARWGWGGKEDREKREGRQTEPLEVTLCASAVLTC